MNLFAVGWKLIVQLKYTLLHHDSPTPSLNIELKLDIILAQGIGYRVLVSTFRFYYWLLW